MNTSPVAPSGFIVTRRFDLVWFFGGFALALGILVAALASPAILPILIWVWLLGFDGPHLFASYTRSYMDRRERTERAQLIGVPLVAFLVGPTLLIAGAALGTDAPFKAFLGAAVVYGHYHVVRQHYGFYALYQAKMPKADGDRAARARQMTRDRWALYLCAWTPYLHLLLTHPRARAAAGLGDPSAAEGWLGIGLVSLWVLTATLLLASLVRRAAPKRSLQASVYLGATVLFYGLVYLVVGRMEPLYTASTSPDQDFLLVTVLISIAHNIEYMALVWFHNRARYAGQPPELGLAARVSGSAARYLAVCLGSSVIYFLVVSATGVYPLFKSLEGQKVGPFEVSALALALYWGLATHHYWLDQRIWRLGKDPELRKNLGLA